MSQKCLKEGISLGSGEIATICNTREPVSAAMTASHAFSVPEEVRLATKEISHAGPGLNVLGVSGIGLYLPAQPVNVVPHEVVLALVANPPHFLQEIVRPQHLSGAPDQFAQQAVLDGQ